MWYLYILESKDGRLYTGITTDLKNRIKKHKQGKGARFTRAFGVRTFVYSEKFPTRSEAAKRESHIKRLTRKEKLRLISQK